MEAHSRGGLVLVCPADRLDEAVRALSEGADVLDVAGAAREAVAAMTRRLGAAAIWGGDRAAPLDADRLARDAGLPAGPACAAAVAAIAAWTGCAPAVRTRHTRAARRAIDMAETIRGERRPSLTVRGLA